MSKCMNCERLDNNARTRQDLSVYKSMLNRIRRTEEAKFNTSSPVYHLQVKYNPNSLYPVLPAPLARFSGHPKQTIIWLWCQNLGNKIVLHRGKVLRMSHLQQHLEYVARISAANTSGYGQRLNHSLKVFNFYPIRIPTFATSCAICGTVGQFCRDCATCTSFDWLGFIRPKNGHHGTQYSSPKTRQRFIISWITCTR